MIPGDGDYLVLLEDHTILKHSPRLATWMGKNKLTLDEAINCKKWHEEQDSRSNPTIVSFKEYEERR